ncbi:MAG: hypothetical protein ACRDRX_07745 [Pseudonocardiaceae bacterium]
MSKDQGEPASGNRRVICVSCSTHGGSEGFTNLVMRQLDGEIELDPHATGACVLRFDEQAAIAVRDAFTEWLGMSVLPKGVVPLQAGRGGSR